MSVEQVLVADDDALCREVLTETLKGEGYEVTAVSDGREAIELIRSRDFDLIFTDLRMPGADGLRVLEEARKLLPEASVLITTAFGTVEVAVQAMRRGAQDFIIKPYSPDQILLMVERLERAGQLQSENRYLKSELMANEGAANLVGEHPSIKELLRTLRTVAKSKATILVQGESGTGKELVARLAHQQSPRSDKPFVRVNCAALSETLLESELFGHEKGAFTGAIQKREGRFELAHRGTLLLDEISEIAPSLQAKLLRVLEEEELERVGGSRTLKVDVRIVGTTNRDLTRAIEEGSFREDLYYRLNVVPIVLPPLRERRSDIPIIARHFLRMYASANATDALELTADAEEHLLRYDWPGNVRELRNVIQRAVVLRPEGVLKPEHFSLERSSSSNQPPIFVGMTLAEMEREMILKTLKEADYNRTAAAKVLGLTSRTLTNKIRLYRSQGFEIKGGRSPSLRTEVS